MGVLIIGLIIWGAISLFGSDSGDNSYGDVSDSDPSSYYADEGYGYDGYSWAENNDVSSFEECQDQFGTSYEEDECNRYVKDNYSGYNTFSGYDCTEDCSGHEAGYNWAEENDILMNMIVMGTLILLMRDAYHT